MSNVLNQEVFNEKTMISDAKGRLIPQHYDTTDEIFKPNSNGLEIEVNRNNNGNPYQNEFGNKNLLVDRKRRPIPQYYDAEQGVFKPITQSHSGEQRHTFGKFKWFYNEETESLDLIVNT